MNQDESNTGFPPQGGEHDHGPTDQARAATTMIDATDEASTVLGEPQIHIADTAAALAAMHDRVRDADPADAIHIDTQTAALPPDNAPVLADADAAAQTSPQSEISHPQSQIPNPQSEIPSPQSEIQNPQSHEAIPPPAPPAKPLPRPRIIALMNQKGGVGKTTTTVNLGACLAHMGHRVLLIDLDPQGHLSLHVGLEPDALERSIYDLLTDDDVSVYEVLLQVQGAFDGRLAVLPAQVNLAGAETELAPRMVTGMAQRMLKDNCQPLIEQGDPNTGSGGGSGNGGHAFDFVLIDCPPSLGLLTINALSFADEVIVPMQAHFLGLQGLSKLLETVGYIKRGFNPNLNVSGVILCMHEAHTILASEVVADLTGFLEAARTMDVPWRDAVLFQPPIRRNIKLAECPSFGKTILDYEPGSAGAKDYRALAASVAAYVRK